MLAYLLAACLLVLHSTRLPSRPYVRRLWGTFNLPADLSRAARLRGYEQIIDAGVHLFGVQESQRTPAKDYVPHGWGTLHKPGGVMGRCAIHWREDTFRFLAGGHPLLHLAMGLSFRSAHRVFTWGRFLDLKAGRKVTFIVLHFVPHADDARGGITAMPRRKLVIAGVRCIIALVKATTRTQVIVVGDLNVNLAADLKHHDPTDLVESFATAGLVPVPVLLGHTPRPTHGPRNTYDQAYVKVPKVRQVLVVTDEWTLPHLVGDHLAYVFETVWTIRTGWKALAA